LFGYLGYDLKNETEFLSTNGIDTTGFPDIFFFVPSMVFMVSGDQLTISTYPETTLNEADLKEMTDEINRFMEPEVIRTSGDWPVRKRITREAYLQAVNEIKTHITRGDIYELNFCQEFFIQPCKLDPFSLFRRLSAISPNPFSCFIQFDEYSIISASPERFLKKMGNRIVSQPIKGTSRRGKDPEEDRLLAENLRNHPKERAENIMITDLVRNDLSKTSTRGSVRVSELCGIYTYPQVHQMITTIESEVAPDTHPADIIRNAFPMGSMTGAPKIRAMELIDFFEATRRGPFSGAAGYFDPSGNFDLNVLIRTAFYNKQSQYLCWFAGSAITDPSDPSAEYEECLLKALAIEQAL
jgi:para-aminobenzoate synthetase component 1